MESREGVGAVEQRNEAMAESDVTSEVAREGAGSRFMRAHHVLLYFLGAVAAVTRPRFHFDVPDITIRQPAPVLGIAAVAGILDITGSTVFILASQIGRLDDAVVLSSLYPAVTVVLARIFLHEHFSRARTLGMVAALVAVPMIAG